MKKSMITLCAAVLMTGSLAVNRIVAAATPAKFAVIKAIEDKVKIKPEELPEPVRTKLSGDDFKGWSISSAYLYKESKTYEVELKKSGETKTVKFDSTGKEV